MVCGIRRELPHRQLRNDRSRSKPLNRSELPHRQLRKWLKNNIATPESELPHRQLRNFDGPLLRP